MADICPHCLTQLQNQSVCPRCGGNTFVDNGQNALNVGSVLYGSNNHSFVLGKMIGSGGFGITYIGKEIRSNRLVAIKEYYPKICEPQRIGMSVKPCLNNEAYAHGLKSFLSEASMLRAVVDIPSIVHVLDYFEANNTAYMVMDYLDGLTLKKVVETYGAISFAELLPKLRVLMNDIDRLHLAGVVHRDIAPDNIMLMPDGSLKLLDFGCARSMEDGKAMTVVLKPGFAPVEQYQTRGQGPYTDIYALCATVYYCITGGKIPQTSPDRLSDDQLQRPTAFENVRINNTFDKVRINKMNEDLLIWGLAVNAVNRPQRMSELAARFVDEMPPAISVAQMIFTNYQPIRNIISGRSGGTSVEPPTPPKPIPTPPQPVPTPPQPVPPGPTPNPNKSNKVLFIVIGVLCAIIVILLIAVVAANALRGRSDDSIKKPTGGGGTQSQSRPVNEPDLPEPDDVPQVQTTAPEPIVPIQTEPQVFTDGDYEYIIESGGAVLTKYNGNETAVDIPFKFENTVVTSIAADAFKNCDNLITVHLPLYLESIESNAFNGCKNLRLVDCYTDASGSTPFFDCPSMRAVVYYDGAKPSWSLPQNAKYLESGAEYEGESESLGYETWGGHAESYLVSEDGVIYGSLSFEPSWAIIEVPPTVKTLRVPIIVDVPVTLADTHAFDNVSSDFTLSISQDTDIHLTPEQWSSINFAPEGATGCTDVLAEAISLVFYKRSYDLIGRNAPEYARDAQSTKIVKKCAELAAEAYFAEGDEWNTENVREYLEENFEEDGWINTCCMYYSIDSENVNEAVDYTIEQFDYDNRSFDKVCSYCVYRDGAYFIFTLAW